MTSEQKPSSGDDQSQLPSAPGIGELMMGGTAPADSAPEFTSENVPCLRDCRYYMCLRTHFEHGNAGGTFEDGYSPTERHHFCEALSGTEPMTLSADAPVLECSHWDPIPLEQQLKLAQRRDAYFVRQDWQPMPSTTKEGHDDNSASGDGPE